MNLCEALESGKRYNRAIRQSHWRSGVYLYDKDGSMFIMSPPPSVPGGPFEFTTECLIGYDWELSLEAPWSGPAGVITKERAEEIVDNCWEACADDKFDGGTDTGKLREKLVEGIMTLGNSTIAFTDERG